MTLALGCRPSAPARPTEPPPPPPSAAAPQAAASGATHAVAADAEVAPPAAVLPHTCTIELELVTSTGATGHGTSDASLEAAKEAAWAQACARLRESAGLDCKDPERTGVLEQSSSTSVTMFADPPRKQMRFELRVELGSRRTARGFGDAPGDRQEACRRAKAHACELLVGGPCPDAGVRVIAVDGKPPNAAAVEPVAPAQGPRETI